MIDLDFKNSVLAGIIDQKLMEEINKWPNLEQYELEIQVLLALAVKSKRDDIRVKRDFVIDDFNHKKLVYTLEMDYGKAF